MISGTFRNLFQDSFRYDIAIISILLIFGIPILMMIYKGVRMVFRITRPHRMIGITALVLWLSGLGLGIYSIVNAAKSFSETEMLHDVIQLPRPHADTLFLRVNIDKEMENADYRSRWNSRYHYARRWTAVSVNGEELKLGYPDLNIVPSSSDSFELVVYRSARGYDRRDAMENAKGIHYPITVSDSQLTFSNYFTIGEDTRWRAQDVHVELRVPKNKVVYLEGSMRDILYDVDNVSHTLDEDMVGRRWKMTDNGLTCIDCAGLDIGETKPAPRPANETPAIKPDSTAKNKK